MSSQSHLDYKNLATKFQINLANLLQWVIAFNCARIMDYSEFVKDITEITARIIKGEKQMLLLSGVFCVITFLYTVRIA